MPTFEVLQPSQGASSWRDSFTGRHYTSLMSLMHQALPQAVVDGLSCCITLS